MNNLTSMNQFMTGLVAIGGSCALVKGVKDLDERSKVNKTLAKAEIISGSVALTFSVLNVLFSNATIDKKLILMDAQDVVDFSEHMKYLRTMSDRGLLGKLLDIEYIVKTIIGVGTPVIFSLFIMRELVYRIHTPSRDRGRVGGTWQN